MDQPSVEGAIPLIKRIVKGIKIMLHIITKAPVPKVGSGIIGFSRTV